MARLARAVSGEDGQSLAEYALIGALIAVVAIAVLTGLGQAIVGKLGMLKQILEQAAPGS